MVICIAEDRPSEEIAVKLLLLSLANHCQHLQVELFFPPATEDFQNWIAQFPQVRLRTTPIQIGCTWNIKPYALLMLLEEGHDEVWWIDSDIILYRDFLNDIGQISDSTLVITEESLYGQHSDDGFRAIAWGFEVGRPLPFNLNTGVLRVTRSHIVLLSRWQELLETEDYRRSQTLSYAEKPFHMASDQDVLTALLASKEFSEVPLKILERGKNIIQYFGPSGFTLKERIANITKGLPTFIHSQGEKPWRRGNSPPKGQSIRKYIDYVRLELSPYNYVASQYKKLLHQELEWLNHHSIVSKVLSILGLGHPALIGLPLAFAYSVIRLYKKIVGINDQFDPAVDIAKINVSKI